MVILKKLARATAIGTLAFASGGFNVASAGLSKVPSGTYNVDPTQAYITFQYNHLGLSNPILSFDDFTVDLNLDSEDPTKSMILVAIDPASIITGSPIFKDNLIGADWFDVAAYPDIIFQSSTIEATGDDTYAVNGELTIKGQSRPVTLNVTVNAAMNHPITGKPVIGIDATAELLRSDFGMDKFVPQISDEIALSITAELSKVQ